MALIYLALAVYETESRQISSRIQALWILADDAPKKTAALIRRAAIGVVRFLDRLLGERLFSVKVFSVSLQLCLASILFGLWLAHYIAGRIAWPLLALMLTSAWLGNSAVSWRRKAHYGVSAIIAGPLVFFAIFAELIYEKTRWFGAILIHQGAPPFEVEAQEHILSFSGLLMLLARNLLFFTSRPTLIAVLVDVAVIAMVRVMTERAARSSGAITLFATFVANVAVSLALIFGPLAIMAHYASLDAPRALIVPWAAYSVANLITLIPAVLFGLLALLLVIDGVLLSLASRLIYAIHRFELLEKRKTLLGFAAVLLAYAIPDWGGAVLDTWTDVKKQL